MTVTQIIGALLIALVFLTLTGAMVRTAGWRDAMLICVTSIVMTSIFGLGAYLLTNN